MIKKLNITAIRTDNYEIYIDDQIYNAEALKVWSSVFHKVESVEEFSEALAFSILRQGSGNFFEGFGIVKTLYSNGHEMSQCYQGKIVTEDQYAPGLLIKLIDEDSEHEFEVKEID